MFDEFLISKLFLFSVAAASEQAKSASSGLVGENDLLIVGPGVLGRLVADYWRQVHLLSL